MDVEAIAKGLSEADLDRAMSAIISKIVRGEASREDRNGLAHLSAARVRKMRRA